MLILFYKDCNFKPENVESYEYDGSVYDFFAEKGLNKEDFCVVDKTGFGYIYDVVDRDVAIYPKIGSKSFWKGFAAIAGIFLVMASGGALGAISGALGLSGSMVHTLGMGLLCYGGGSLMMGKMKMPSIDFSAESSTQASYQWNVGNLSTSRGVRGITFGDNVIPEGELLAYRTYGTSRLSAQFTQQVSITPGYYKDLYVTDRRGRKRYNGRQWIEATKTVKDIYQGTVGSDGTSYLEMLIGCGEGELDDISGIKINGTAIENIEGAEWETRKGSNMQEPFSETNLDSQIGYLPVSQNIPQKLGGTVSPLVVTTPVACDSCIIALKVNSWYMYDLNSGAKNYAYINPQIGYRLNGSSNPYTYVKTGVDEIDNGKPIKSESAFYFEVKIDFPTNGTYDICLENDSAELNHAKGLLSASEYASLPDKAVIGITCDNMACYDKKEQTYPNTALIRLKLPASQMLNGSMPEVTWKQSRTSVITYNGNSYVNKPANNLAWAIYDVLAQIRRDNFNNSYHTLGEDTDNIDYEAFAVFAEFCEAIGAKGNWFLNKLSTAWETAQEIAASARAFIGLKNGKLYPYWDSETSMTQIFTSGNIERLSGAIVSKHDRAKAIEATFNDQDSGYESRTIRVYADNAAEDDSEEAVKITFAGLSSKAAVFNAAKYILKRNRYLTDTVTFTANIDSIVCELNDVIGIQSDITQWGVGGRVYNVEGNKIALDAPVTIESGKSYSLLVRLSNGVLERRTPDETSGTYTILNFTHNPFSGSVQTGDVFSFGISNQEVRKYRVTGITRTSDLKAEIEAVEYDPAVYAQEVYEDSGYNNPQANVNSLTVVNNPESLDLAWHKDVNTAWVELYIDGVFQGRYSDSASIPNINSDQNVELRPVNMAGEEGTPVVREISNAIPSPSVPVAPIVQSNSLGAVAMFEPVPENENIVWLVIKENGAEIGRSPVAGSSVTVQVQLSGGVHILTAYYLNSYNKTSLGRDFTASPTGIDTALLQVGALSMPQGSILRLSAKGCTTESIKEENGVKDVSGYGHHGRAYGGVEAVLDTDMGAGFSFNASAAAPQYIKIARPIDFSGDFTVVFDIRANDLSKIPCLFDCRSTANDSNFYIGTKAADDNRIRFVTRAGGIGSVYLSELELELNRHYQMGFSYGSENAKLRIYINGVLDSEHSVINKNFVVAAESFIGSFYNRPSNRNAGLIIPNFRIYQRRLSDTDFKTLHMLPQEALFAQLNADMIGANAIHSRNIFVDDLLRTLVIEAVNAKINDLNVTGNATFISNNQTIADNIASAKSQAISTAASDATAKVKAVTDNIYTPNTTTINGGNIATDSIDTDKLKASSVTAEKLDVTSSFPSDPIFRLSANGMTDFATGAVVPNLAYRQAGGAWKIVNGALGSYSNPYGQAVNINTDKGAVQSSSAITIGGSWTFACRHNGMKWSENAVFVDAASPATNASRITIYATPARKLMVVLYDSNGHINSYDTGITLNNNQQNFIAVRQSGTVLKAFHNGTWKNIACVAHASANLTVTLGNTLQLPSRGTGNMILWWPSMWSRALSDDEITGLYKFKDGGDVTGQINADRLATDAVQSRNRIGGSDGGYTTSGSIFDLRTGWLSTPKTCIGSDGKIRSTDVDLSGKITATSGSFSGSIFLPSKRIYSISPYPSASIASPVWIQITAPAPRFVNFFKILLEINVGQIELMGRADINGITNFRVRLHGLFNYDYSGEATVELYSNRWIKLTNLYGLESFYQGAGSYSPSIRLVEENAPNKVVAITNTAPSGVSALGIVKTLNNTAAIIRRYITDSARMTEWSDGWIEQGGRFDMGSVLPSAGATITFPKPFPTKVCNIVATANRGADNGHAAVATAIGVFSNTSFYARFDRWTSPHGSRHISWSASGY